MRSKQFPESQVCACCGAVRNPATDQHFIILNPNYTEEEQQWLPSAFDFQYIQYFKLAPELHFCSTKCLVKYLNSPNPQLAWAKFGVGEGYDEEERKPYKFRPTCRHCEAELKENENSAQDGVITYKAIVVVSVYGSSLFNEKYAGEERPHLFCSMECLVAACGTDDLFSSVGFWNRPEHQRCPQCGAVDRPYEHGSWLVLNYEPQSEEGTEGGEKYLHSSDPEHREVCLCSSACVVEYLKGQPTLKWFKVPEVYEGYDFCGHCHGHEAESEFLSLGAPYGSIFDENFAFFCSVQCAIRECQRDDYDAKRGPY